MEVITPPRPAAERSVAPLVGTTLLGTALVVGGLTLAYVAFATPVLTMVLPDGRPSAGQMAGGMLVWAIALVAPAGFVLLGANRLARLLAAVRGRVATNTSPTTKALAGLGDGVVVASGLTLGDGRGVSDVVLGPFGAVIVRQLPPPAVTRIQNGHWQLRTQRGWIPMENPLERAARDAERVRRFLAHDDADFVVKVYAAVIGPDTGLQRTAACAVLTPDQLAPWIDGLPAQRSLTENRRNQMIELVREAAGLG